ncbi:hypothetical protein N7468_008151 [Penicillium chermesinum]|uniref:HTH araC/xylS-type domain-containing protein n=1 Tax=Penicillium chermesinum TaxID=63820 RepID=A0A9W9TID3_9EURO|nr:uncharacterized protein N7468_008151 [Penicillium chermesinum]KAJ5223609.1 hypothetical protein N7468_008151 [Penicillium chermesinum]KAJ6155563.1 hypothetical protein N7470_006129 [Penicillium chermesinum]
MASVAETAPQKLPRLHRSGDALTSAERWQAITKRDTSVNSFVYGVLTTKIYCRPSCSARLARRANVEFYDEPSQAERAGFRPCKRCRPQTGGTAAQNNPQAAVIEKTCQAIREEVAAGRKPRLLDLAAGAGLTPSHLHRVFKKLVGVTPGQYASSIADYGACPSPDSLSPNNFLTPEAMLDLETPVPFPREFVGTDDLKLDTGRGGVASAIEGPAATWEDYVFENMTPVIVDQTWNDFDALFAESWPLDSYVNPRLITEPE